MYVLIARESAECAGKKLRDTHFVILIDAADEDKARLSGLQFLQEKHGVTGSLKISSATEVTQCPQLLFTG